MIKRRSLCTPIPEIFAAARLLLRAVDQHAAQDFDGASSSLLEANDKKVWNYTDHAWGKGSSARYAFRTLPNSPPRLSVEERPAPRMPNTATKLAVIERDGYHCRFCGIPVIDPALRTLFKTRYPAAVEWGATNLSQHAAFQCMWLQYDHVLPNSRGGDSSFDNIVIACAACNFGRMEATLDEADLLNPLDLDPLIAWDHHAEWDGLERFRLLGSRL